MLVLGLLVAFWYWSRMRASDKTRDRILEKARIEADNIVKELEAKTKEELDRERDRVEKTSRNKLKDIDNLERNVVKKEDNLSRKLDLLNKKEQRVQNLEKSMERRNEAIGVREQDLERVIDEEKQTLYRISDLGKDEAEKMLLVKMEKDFAHEQEVIIARMVDRIKDQAEVRSREILATCMQRMASTYCQEITTSAIEIPSDEMKGRVIGREGRNIRAFEKCTGVDVIVDDTPGVIIISCFDSIRREMARRSMDKLIADGRIHPTRIEEIVTQTKKEMNEIILQEGKQAIFDLNIPGMHPKLVTLLGRLKFRTSYGQNVLYHVKECSYLAGLIAAELNLDVQLAKRCALLHDVGKSVDHEIEGGHPEIGANIAKRYDEPAEVINSIASHHNDVPQESIYAIITQRVFQANIRAFQTTDDILTETINLLR